MSGKYLIIGDKTISSALVRVLGILNLHTYEIISTNDYPDTGNLIDSLENIRGEEFNGIILNGSDSIELFKHIRLTNTLGNLSLLPIIVLSTKSLTHLLRERKDNIMLLTPECYVIPVSSYITEILSAMEISKSYVSLETMREEIRPFVIWSEEDDVISRHDNFNRYGPFKLMKESFGTLSDPLLQEYDAMSNKLWFKKYQFLEAKNTSPIETKFDEDLFRKMITNKKVLYIDDEHRLGWSFALYSILAGNSDYEMSQIFKDSTHFVSSPDNRLSCIDSYEDAVSLFESYSEALTKALSEYSEAEHIRNALSEQFAVAKQKFSETEAKYKNAKASLERSEKNFLKTEANIKTLQQKFKGSIDTLADAYLKGTEDPEVLELLPPAKELSETYEQFSKELSSLSKYKEECKRNSALLEALNKEYLAQQQSLKEVESKKTVSSKRYDVAVNALVPGKLFPYDLIILDLRLERLKDKEALPHEISGVKLLRKIKEIDPSIPALMFTASEKAMNYREVIDLGASGYWIKAINSASELKSEIIKSLSKAHDARNLWVNIKKVEAKRQLACFRENTQAATFEKYNMHETKKDAIILTFKESFLLLMREPSSFEELLCNYTNYAKIALNMGLILEERYSNIYGDKWDKWIRQKKIDTDDARIRQIRNKAAHQASADISYQEAVEAFQKTLNRCLKS